MIRFITGANDGDRCDRLRASIQACVGTTGWELKVVPGNAKTVAAKWNSGSRDTDAEILVFCHNDIDIYANTICLAKFLEIVRLPDSGFVGVCGATMLNSQGTWWGNNEGPGVCRGLVGAPAGWLGWPGPAKFGQVLIVDGVFMACRRAALEKIGGFNEYFAGAHFYDVDASIRMHKAGFKNHVACFPIYHDSTGIYDGVWDAERQKFLGKWAKDLPMNALAKSGPVFVSFK